MEKEQILLRGGKVHLTQDKQSYYRILSGKVILYIASIKEDNTHGRKHFLAEFGEENKEVCIPSLKVEDEDLGNWIFIIAALQDALLERGPYNEGKSEEEVILNFATTLHLRLEDSNEFNAEVIEKVQRILVSEELSIYRNQNENEKMLQESLQSISDVFHKNKTLVQKDKTKNNLYNTTAFLCKKRGIKIAPYETVVESSGRRFTLQDIARVSHFMLREVQLDCDWYKKDSGYLIVYKETTEEDSYVPLACLPSEKSNYTEYNIEENTVNIINEDRNKNYLKAAYMIYRPLPNRSLILGDLVKFTLGEVHKSDVTFILALTLLGTIIGLLIPYLNQIVYDEYIPFGNVTSILQIGIMVIAFSIGNLCFSIVKNISIYRVSTKMEYSLQSAVFDRLFNLPGRLYESNDSTVLSKSAFGITEICAFVSEAIITTILSAVFSLTYLYRMYAYSSELAIKGLLMVIFQVTLIFVIGFIQLKQNKDITDIHVKESSLIYQFIDGISKIRIAGVENRALVKYFDLYLLHKKKLYQKDKLSNLSININFVLNIVFTASFYSILVKQNIPLSFGNFMAFISAFGIFSAAILQVATTFSKANHLIPLYNKCKLILESTQEFKEDLQMAGFLKGTIEVNNVTFTYHEKQDNVISDVSFKIDSGEYIGIVGASGSGKSSLLKLLLGFEKPSSGKIYYDDKDLDSLDKRELRKCFGVVLQEGKLISGSIYENIVLAGTTMSQEEREKEKERILEVIKEVGLDSDIQSMPMGLQTIIAEGAGTISGGQRQKILIARAIFNNPRILFFDEATSALDNMNQSLVTKNLEKLNITRIVIAHRLSTIMNCNRIFVLQGGRIVEMGSYTDLMKNQGYFYQLSHRQMA